MKVFASRPLGVVVGPQGMTYFQPGRGLSVFDHEAHASDFHRRQCASGDVARMLKFVPVNPKRKAAKRGRSKK